MNILNTLYIQTAQENKYLCKERDNKSGAEATQFTTRQSVMYMAPALVMKPEHPV